MKRPPATVEQIADQPQLRQHRKLTLAQVREVFAALERRADFSSAFAREALRQVPEAEWVSAWSRTSEALSKAGRQYSIGDAAFRDTMERFQEPTLLAACQAGTVAGSPSTVVAAALVKDGSAASYDALMADFERARANTKDDWALRYKFSRLARYAKPTAEWKALHAAVRQELARRDEARATNETSVARALGLGVPLLSFSLWLQGRGPTVWLTVDDRRGQWSLQVVGQAHAGQREFEPIELPRAIAEAGSGWRWEEARVTTNLRGVKRTVFLEWLQRRRAHPIP